MKEGRIQPAGAAKMRVLGLVLGDERMPSTAPHVSKQEGLAFCTMLHSLCLSV